ncbi:MAG: hypothetical protein ACXAC8_03160 [Candidatus Hodarchaeales archaeon]|jgi:hypothetical protein
MGSLSLALKDIFRQKQRSFLFIGIQSLITASGVIVYGITNAISTQVGEIKVFMNSTIVILFIGYLNFLLIFTIVSGIVIAAILSSILTISRLKDLTVLLSLGGTFTQIQRVPLAQIFLLTTIAGILGWVEGVLVSTGLLLLLRYDLSQIQDSYNLYFGLIYLISQIIGTYLVAGFIVNKLIRGKLREIIDGQYDIDIIDHSKVWGISMRGKIGFLLAYLFNRRSRTIGWVLLIGTFILIFLPSFGVLGGNIVSNTTISYIDRGFGSNVYIITTQEFSQVVQELYDPYGNIQFEFSSSETEQVIPDEFLNQLAGNYTYEARLLSVGKARMITSIQVDNSGNLIYGPDKTLDTYYWGINENKFPFFDYYAVGDITSFQGLSVPAVQVGDGIAQEYFDLGILESLVPTGEIIKESKRFEINGVIMDPFARGYSVYMKTEELISLWNFKNDFKNIVFVSNPDEKMFQLIDEFSLHSFSLDVFKEKYQTINQSLWILSAMAFIPAIISAGLSLVAYSGLVARTILIKDLKILRALGGKPQTLKRIIIWVNLLFLLNTGPLAILFGFICAFTFLIEDPLYPTIDAWLLLGVQFILMAFIIYISLHYIFKEFYNSF